MLSFQSVELDTNTPDRDAALVFRDGRLLAVLTRLSDIHEDLAGKWFLETAYADLPVVQPAAFDSKRQFEDWLGRAG